MGAVNNGRVYTPKFHRSNRPIQLTEDDMRRLRVFLARRPGASPGDWVFASDRVNGPKQYASIMTRKIQPKAMSLGLPHVTWRLFRHWHATLLGDAKVPIKATQERLGHSRAEITMKYYTRNLLRVRRGRANRQFGSQKKHSRLAELAG